MEFAFPQCGKTAFRLMTPTEQTIRVTVASHASDNFKRN
jgi:hypothetical protein